MKSVFALPGSVTVKGREFVIPAPTATDMARVREQMRLFAQKRCTEPLRYVAAQLDGIPAAVATLAIREALAMGTGGGVEPTPDAIAREYDTLEGVRWRLWYHAHAADKGVTSADVEALVMEDDRFDVADALFVALRLGERADAPKALPAGAN